MNGSAQADRRYMNLLLVEDNPADVHLTREALKEGQISNIMNVVSDGVKAISYLRRKEKYVNAVRPDIILLDINLPRKNGLEVLAEVKEDPNLRRIPVIILTTSKAEQDILSAYDLHANCYITKPLDYERFLKAVKSIEDFWFTVVTLPPRT